MPDTSATTSSAKSVHATSPPAKPEVTDQSLLGQRSFLAYLGARCVSEYSYQIATVAIGWQIYELTGSAFQLGMVGLVQFIPSALLVFVAGHAADRYDRRRIAQICQVAEGLINAGLAWGTFAGWLTAPQIFIALVVLGITAAFAVAVTVALTLHVGDVILAYAPGSIDAMMILALALHLDPVFVGAHHLARVFTVTLALPLIVRAIAPASKSKSGRPVRPKDGEFSD